MKQKFSRHYQKALLNYLEDCSKENLLLARGMGRLALAAGLQILDLAKLHEYTLITRVLTGHSSRKRATLIRQAGKFFVETITPIEKAHPDSKAAAIHLSQIVGMLSQRTVELAASNRDLETEISQRKVVEAALKKSEQHCNKLLKKSDRMQEHLRQLSRQILATQEEERRKISRELHDVIAQTLTGINMRLATLKKEAEVNTRGIERNIARTQQLVEQSVNIVHQFARELRPAVLDDLGLIAALHSFLKNFTTLTGIRTGLTAYAGVEKLDITKRTALFRVAQEALTNVHRHANASRVEISIQNLPDCICMTIKDNGKSFNVKRALRLNGGKSLGLLGMQERLEMVGGCFHVESAPEEGTTIAAKVPFGKVPLLKPSIL